jgi:hypothetical protein
MKIRIHVTEEILRKSMYCPMLRTCPESELDIIKNDCAVSEAVRELFPRAKVFQTGANLDWTVEDSCVSFNYETQAFIRSFDNVDDYDERLLIPAYSFELTVPQSLIDAIGITEIERILSESKTLEAV